MSLQSEQFLLVKFTLVSPGSDEWDERGLGICYGPLFVGEEFKNLPPNMPNRLIHEMSKSR